MNPTKIIIKRSLCVLALLIGLGGARAQITYPTITTGSGQTTTMAATTIAAGSVNTNRLGFTVETVQLSYSGSDSASPFNVSLAAIYQGLGPAFSGANPTTPVDNNGISAGGSVDPTSMAYAQNTADLSLADAYGYFFLPGYINMDYAGAGDVVGDFSTPNWPKKAFPGIPGTGGGATTDQFACSFTGYIFISSPGATFGVNSDDDFGLTLSTSLNPLDPSAVLVGSFPAGGRGAADTIFRVNVPSSGYYAMRLVYDQGTGGANCEFFTVLSNGTGILVNDTNNPAATLAYPAPDFNAKPFIVSTVPAAGATGIIPNAPGNIVAVLQDGGVSANTNSIQFFINGHLVATNGSATLLVTNTPIFSPSGISIGNIDSVTFLASNAAILPNGTLLPNANNTMTVIFTDSGGASNTNSWTFRTTGAPVSNNSGNTSVNTSAHGFLVYPYMAVGLYQNDPLSWSETMLMGILGPNYANFSNWPAADYGAILTNGPHGQAYIWTNYINWDWQGAGDGAGDWLKGAGYPKSEFPGVVGITAGGTVGTYYTDEASLTGNSSDNFTQLVEAWIYVPGAGVWNMGVNSDDGFAVFSGTTPNDTFGSFLGAFDGSGGRGASDTIFGFQVKSAGFYPFRMVYEEGGGGANCEWFTFDVNGNKQLINDSTNLFQAYYAATNYPAYVQGVYPPIGAGLNGLTLGGLGAGGPAVFFPNGPVAAQLVDGAPNKITSVKLYTNNVQATLSSSNYAGGVTTIQVGNGSSYFFPVGSSNSATLIYTDAGGTSYTNSWSFLIANYTSGITGAANQNAVTPINGANVNQTVSTNGTNFGFIVYPYQEGGVAGPQNNDVNVWSELTMIGLNGINGADLSLADGIGPSGPFYIWGPNSGVSPGPAYINWAIPGDGQVFGPFENVYGGGLLDWPKVNFPGIDGTVPTTSFAELVEAWLYLPSAGVYTSIVDSDDGFSLKSGQAPGDVFGTLLGEFEGGRGNTLNPVFGFSVPTPGFYPFRLLYEQGGGGANCEWLIQGAGSTGPALVADTNFGGINAYMTAQSYPIYVSAVNPVIGQGILGQGGVNPATAISANVVDGIPNTVKSVSFLINGTNAPSTSTKNAATAVTTATVTNPSLLLQGGATNTVTVIYTDSANKSYTNSWQFITQPIGTGILTQNNNTSVSTAQTNIGFLVYPWMTAAGDPNTPLGWTEAQILGLHGPNGAIPGPNPDGSYTWTTYVNWAINNSAADDLGAGDFTLGTGYPKSPQPGWAGAAGTAPAIGGLPANGSDNGTELVLTYLNFTTAGLYTMLVNSDDDFTVKSGQAPGDVFGTVLGQASGGRGSADSTFAFLIPQAGFYPMRLLYENGGGGANCEWGMVTPSGQRVLLNDTNLPALTIYPYLTATNSPIYVSGVVPVIGAGNNGEPAALPFSSVVAYVHDGNPNKVASVSLIVNGTAATTTTTKSGGVTTAVASPALKLGANNTASVIYTDTANHSYTNTWTFAVAGPNSNQSGTAITLDYTLGYKLGAQNTNLPGFQAVTAQIVPGTQGSQITDSRWADQMIVGLGSKNDANVQSVGTWFANVANLADTTYPTVNGWFWLSNTINLDISTNGGDGDFTAANGAPDKPFPAIPGNLPDTAGTYTDSFETEFKTWLVFQTAGTYTFTVSSDDGFRVTEATNHGRLTGLGVSTGTSNYMIPAIPQYPDNGGTIGKFLPTSNLLSGQLVLGNPILATNLATNLVNATQVAGKIVVLQRGGTGGSQQLEYVAAQAGAIALVEISNDANGNPPTATLGGTNNGIPVLLISIDDGLALSNSLASGANIMGSMGDDASLVLGQYQGGRGFSDTDFQVIVPEPGVYPFRIIYYQGGGGGNMEFSQWINGAADGVKNQALVNDTAHGAVAAFATINPGSTPLGAPTGGGGTVGNITGITVSGNQVTITWTAPGFLEQASSLAVSGGAKWSHVTPAPTGTTYTTSTSGGPLFFRLSSQ